MISTITNGILENTQLKFGIQNIPGMDSKAKIMVLANGPVSPYVQAVVDSDNGSSPINMFGF